VIAAFSAACHDMSNCVLAPYSLAYTNYVDCLPMVIKDAYNSANQNGFYSKSGIQIQEIRNTNSQIESKLYFALMDSA
jgi:hypothetical protein